MDEGRPEENGGVTVTIQSENRTGWVLGMMGLVTGVISIFILSIVFVPLSVLFNIMALFMRQYMLAVVGLIAAGIGLLTSPTLMFALGLGALLASNGPEASKTSEPKQTVSRPSMATPSQSNLSETPSAQLVFVEPKYSAWEPPHADQVMPVTVNGQQDTVNMTRDQSCKFIYKGNNAAPYEDRYIINDGVDCSTGLLHGNGKVGVFRVDGKKLGEVSGAFSRGYYTYDKVWDQPFIGRYRLQASYGKNYLTSLVGSDKALNINIIAYLSHNNTKWRWEWCSHTAPTIGIITNKPEAFKRQDTILPLIQTAANLASFECPKAKKFTVIASPYPTAPMEDIDDKAYFSTVAFMDGKTWSYNPNDRKTVNHYLDRVARYRQLNSQQ